jgi:hypothetical protein
MLCRRPGEATSKERPRTIERQELSVERASISGSGNYRIGGRWASSTQCQLAFTANKPWPPNQLPGCLSRITSEDQS